MENDLCISRLGPTPLATGGGFTSSLTPMGSKMTYPLSKDRFFDESILPSRKPTNYFAVTDCGDGMRQLPWPHEQALAPTILHQAWPRRVVRPAVKTPSREEDELHPLICGVQSELYERANNLHPECGFLANARRDKPPCVGTARTWRALCAIRSNASNERHRGVGDASLRTPFSACIDDEDETSVAEGVAGQSEEDGEGMEPSCGQVELILQGGAFDPSEAVSIAAVAPRTLTMIAAKALGSAIHNYSCERRLTAVPPPAYRLLSSSTRQLLVERKLGSRKALEQELIKAHPILLPPPFSNNCGVRAEEILIPSIASEGSNTAPPQQPCHSESEVKPNRLLSSLELWAQLLVEFAARTAPLWGQIRSALPETVCTESISESPCNSIGGNAAENEALSLLVPTTVSFFDAISTNLHLSRFIAGPGIRQGDFLILGRPATRAGFSAAGTIPVTFNRDASVTPLSCFCFDTERLCRLLKNHGAQLREAFLPSCTWLGCDIFTYLATYCPNLAILDVSGRSALTDDDLNLVTGSCPLIEALNVSDCPLLTPHGIDAALRNCRSLHGLFLRGLPLLGSEDALWLRLSKHHSLRFLDISFCSTISGALFNAVGSYKCAGSLEQVDITGCTMITDEAVMSLGSTLRALSVLRLSGCSQLSASALSLVGAAAGHRLRALDLSGILTVDAEVLDNILSTCSSVETLVFRGCNRVSDAALEIIAARCNTRPGGALLAIVDLSGCFQLTSNGLMHFIYTLKNSLCQVTLTGTLVSSAELRLLQSLSDKCTVIRDHEIKPEPRRLNAYRIRPPVKIIGKKKNETGRVSV